MYVHRQQKPTSLKQQRNTQSRKAMLTFRYMRFSRLPFMNFNNNKNKCARTQSMQRASVSELAKRKVVNERTKRARDAREKTKRPYREKTKR